jgi:hypothetical protein
MNHHDAKKASVSGDVVDVLLQGAIDTHIHGGPDIVPRKMSDADVARAAKKAGMRAVVIKNHVTPTTSRARLVQEAVGDIQVFGGLVLNKAAGGLNPTAVEVELALGAKEIWMPTKSSVQDISRNQGDLAKAVPVTDERGDFRPELYEILDMIAGKDVILGTGHLSAEEIEKLVVLAKQRGLKKILVSHPEFEIPEMPIEMQKRLTRQGVFFERCFYACTHPPKSLSPVALMEQIKATGVEHTIMASDFGQAFNDEPVTGLSRYIKAMLELGFSPGEIETMVGTNPAQLLGL